MKLDNFNLITSNSTKLEEMRNLSIDEIITRYRNGSLNLQNSLKPFQNSLQYRSINSTISNPSNSTIASLAPNMNIVDVGGFYDQGSDATVLIILFTNTSSGYTEIDVLDNGKKSVIPSPITTCLTPITLPPNLAMADYLTEFPGKSSNNKVDVKVYKCSSGENCAPPSCTTLDPNPISSVIGKQVYPYDTTMPSSPIMTLTPGYGFINVTWTQPPSTVPIFAYGIEWNGTIGFLPATAHSYKITGLSAGKIYSVGMIAISPSGVGSPTVMSTSGSIIITPSLSIDMGSTQSLAASCIDYTGTAATCPSLTWTSADESIATVDSSGNVTGISLGTTKITASVGLVKSNSSTITVKAPTGQITIYPASATIDIDRAVQLNYTCSGPCSFTWNTSNPGVATVDTNGLVIGTGYGTALITALSPTIPSNSCTITVSPDHTGYLYVASRPSGANIYIDGFDTEEITPMLITDLTPTLHRCDLYLRRYLEKSDTFLITAGKITSIYEELIPLSSVCQTFNSVPTKAQIFIDDVDMSAKTPYNICNLSIGTHSFRFDGTFIPKADGCFDFSSVPSKAKIFVDGGDTGKITPGRVCVPPGTHTFSLIGIVNITK